MVTRVLTVCFFVVLISFADAQPSNTNISNGVIFDGEPYLAINPTNNQNLVAAWMGLKLSGGQFKVGIQTRASLDGGNTWSSIKPMPHFGTGFGSADVSMAFDKNGLLYICYIDYRQSPDSGGIYVARSADGGLNWDTPSKAFDINDVPVKRPIDRPWLLVDNSNTSNFGTLYITTKPAPWIAPPNRNYYKVSSDSGHTWTAIANVDGGTHLVGNAIAAPMAAPATTLNGKFCALYPSYVSSQNPLPVYYLASSSDKGQSFSYTNVYAAVPVGTDTNLKNGYLLLANPADSQQMVFVVPLAQSGDADATVLHSNDGGQTWSSPVRVNDDATGNGKMQDMVWAAYNKQGKLAVTWRDRRNASSTGFWNTGYDFYYALSADNGQTFSANQKLSSQFIAFDSIVAENGNDFMSCAYEADTLYTVWGDTRSGKMNIYFAKTIVSTNTNVGIALLNSEAANWTIYPNPVQDEFQLQTSDKPSGEEVHVFAADGRKIFSTRMDAKAMNISTAHWAKGVYFVRIGDVVKRLVKE